MDVNDLTYLKVTMPVNSDPELELRSLFISLQVTGPQWSRKLRNVNFISRSTFNQINEVLCVL